MIVIRRDRLCWFFPFGVARLSRLCRGAGWRPPRADPRAFGRRRGSGGTTRCGGNARRRRDGVRGWRRWALLWQPLASPRPPRRRSRSSAWTKAATCSWSAMPGRRGPAIPTTFAGATVRPRGTWTTKGGRRQGVWARGCARPASLPPRFIPASGVVASRPRRYWISDRSRGCRPSIPFTSARLTGNQSWKRSANFWRPAGGRAARGARHPPSHDRRDHGPRRRFR
jgi:hypothetical protein